MRGKRARAIEGKIPQEDLPGFMGITTIGLRRSA
jgi:hypothetical protein